MLQDSIDVATLKGAILNSDYCVIIIGTSWCGPCKKLTTALSHAEANFEEVNFYYIDVEIYPDVADLYNIQSVPTIVLYKSKAIIETIVGAISLPNLIKKVNEMTGRIEGV